MPRARFLFSCELGDPISCVYINEHGCMAGSALGRVWLYSFETKELEMLAAFSEEGIRGLYMDEDSKSSYAIGNEGWRGWRSQQPHPHEIKQIPPVSFRSLDRKNTHNVKHVLQRGPNACVLFPLSSTVVNVVLEEHHFCGFKLVDFASSTDVAPCDFDGETLAVVDRTNTGGPPVFRLVQLTRNDVTEVESLPKASSATLVKLWGPHCLAYVVGTTLLVYDYRMKQVLHTLQGHRGEIVAVDAHSPEVIASLSNDAVVKLWNGVTGKCLQTLVVPEASFFLGYPYCLCVEGKKVLISADEGVYLLEAESTHLTKL